MPPKVTAPPSDGESLEPGERALGSWPAEPVRTDGGTDRVGRLVLTSHRVLFFGSAGLFGRRSGVRPPMFTFPLERLSVQLAQYWMTVGYGDRVEMPGLVLDGHGFRLARETPAGPVKDALVRAREARRAELSRS